MTLRVTYHLAEVDDGEDEKARAGTVGHHDLRESPVWSSLLHEGRTLLEEDLGDADEAHDGGVGGRHPALVNLSGSLDLEDVE